MGFKQNALIRNSNLILAIFCLCACALTWVSRNDPFFWDTVQLGSKHAHFFYENGLKWQPLPIDIDSGHPPVFGYYLAILWTFFGKTLPVSHFAMLPFLWLNVFLLWRIGHRLAGKWVGWFLVLVFSDPVLLGQSVMVSPDVVVVTSFLLVVAGVLGARKWLILLGIMGLCAISMRGMMTAAALLVWAVGLPFFRNFDFRKAIWAGLPFLPGFLFAAWFLWWHWQATGWIGYHDDSPWAGAFKPVSMAGFFRNVLVMGWRWVDFGRVGELMVFTGVAYLYGTKWKNIKSWRSLVPTQVFPLVVCLLVFLLPSALLYQNLSAHRYFLPVFLAVHLLVFQWVVAVMEQQQIRPRGFGNQAGGWLLFVVVICLATGNLWRYPRGISMDWDSTLAHWPYHGLREEAMRFLESKEIDFSQVGSAFPNLNTGENLMLNGDQRQFSTMDFDQNKFVFASNVFNDISQKDYFVLGGHWTLVWQKKEGAVWVEIYGRK